MPNACAVLAEVAEIRLITFDLDETLWPLQPTLAKADRAATQWLIERVPEYEQFVTSGGIVEIRDLVLSEDQELRFQVSRLRLGILNRALQHLGLSQAQALEFAQAAFDIFIKKRQEVELFPGMKEVLKRLSRRYVLGALTNGNADIERVGFDHPFAFFYNAESVGRGKPYPDMFLAALEFSQVQPEESIHIGDSLSMDVVPAQDLGMHALWANFSGLEKPIDQVVRFEARSVEDIEPCVSRIVEEAAVQ